MRFLSFFYMGAFALLCACNEPPELSKGARFTAWSPRQIGIDFENNLEYTEDFNVYLYRSFYNGAGVGMGDFNNDGLLDLFFCGNQADNKLYLNLGSSESAPFQFKDITEEAGVASRNAWSTGVSIADINGDGWLDIYICKSGKPDGENRHNELFINNGISEANGQLSFTESAAAYGIDDLGFSVQAAFFDYDRDGDLDMYLSNNSISPTEVIRDAKQGLRNKREPGGGNKLYRHDGDHFSDVSEVAGIYGSAIGFGLGVVTGDVNRDGWPDVFVANDFFEKDYLYLNNGEKQRKHPEKNYPAFSESLEEAMNEISLGAMGVDIADINNDGLPEIFVTEMLPDGDARLKTKAQFDNWDTYQLKVKKGYHRQFSRNTLQLNNGPLPGQEQVSFSEISRFSGVDATDWSWGVLVVDMDNDGYQDIFISNGIYKDLLDQDYIDFYSDPATRKKIYQEKGAVIKELIDNIPSVPLPNYLYTHQGNLKFTDVSEAWGLGTPGFSNGCAYGDLDNDGDLDLVVNNINMPPFIYENNTRQVTSHHFLNLSLKGNTMNTQALGAQVTLKAGGRTFYQELSPMRGTLSSVDPRLNFGLGAISQIDTLEIQWPEGGKTVLTNIAANQFLTLSQNENMISARIENDVDNRSLIFKEAGDKVGIQHRHTENEFVDFDRDKLIFHMISSEGPELAVGDINHDGRDDFYLGGAKDSPGALFVGQSDGKFIATNQEVFEKDKVSEDAGALFFDADNDGDQDLLVASGSYEFPNSAFALADRLYLNDGQGHLTRSPQVIPNNKLESTSSLAVADFDQDGDLDIFSGVRLKPFQYGVPPDSYLLQNDGQGNFKDVTAELAPGLLAIGMVTDALWMDYDGDKDQDLVVAGEWMPIRVFENRAGKLMEVTDTLGLSQTDGLWNVLEKADLDGDGDLDLVAGNLGLNSQWKASLARPVRMYVNDFDQNGTIEQIITVYDGEEAYPLALKKDITKQMPYLLKKYLKHEDYKEQTMEQIFTAEQLATALIHQAYVMETSVFWNEKGKFVKQALPTEAQWAPIYGLLIDDVNKDGKQDILLGGNLYRAKPQTGIYAGTYGVMLQGNGNQQFSAVKYKESGFYVKGEIRDLKKLNYQDSRLLLVGRNNDSLKIFEY